MMILFVNVNSALGKRKSLPAYRMPAGIYLCISQTAYAYIATIAS